MITTLVLRIVAILIVLLKTLVNINKLYVMITMPVQIISVAHSLVVSTQIFLLNVTLLMLAMMLIATLSKDV
jgi:hypothetical protein